MSCSHRAAEDGELLLCLCASSLLFTKVKLEEALLGPAAALQTCEEMLQEWQSRCDLGRSR